MQVKYLGIFGTHRLLSAQQKFWHNPFRQSISGTKQ